MVHALRHAPGDLRRAAPVHAAPKMAEVRVVREPPATAGPPRNAAAPIDVPDLPWGVFRLGEDGALAAMNPAFAGLLGLGTADPRRPDVLARAQALVWHWRWHAPRLVGGRWMAVRLPRPQGAPRQAYIAGWAVPGGGMGRIGLALPAESAPLPMLREASAARPLSRDWVRDALHLDAEWSRFVALGADASGLGLAISVVPADGGPARLAWVNGAGARILGRQVEELLNGPPFPQVSSAEGERLRLRPPPASGEAGPAHYQMVQRVARPGAPSALVEVRFTLGAYWGQPALFSSFRDVTRERRAMAERRAAADREAELRRLRELDALKTQFLNNAAHELSTPLTPIRVQLHLLRGAQGAGLSAAQSRAVAILDRNFERLSRLVEDLLEAARLESGRVRMRREELDLAPLVEEAAESFQAAAAQAGVHLRAEDPAGLWLEGDPARLAQVLFNLLANAIKFTPRGGHVTVEAQARKGEAVVTVRDDGVGLRGEELDRLFRPFSQVGQGPAEPGRSGGTGLGLFISRGIVRLHGGRIWASSLGPGRGSAFTFALPLRPPALGPREERAQVAPAGTG